MTKALSTAIRPMGPRPITATLEPGPISALRAPNQAVDAIRFWGIGDGQVGGWTTEFDGLNFTTIRNAGHFVPETQAERALYMFKNFVANTPL